MTPLLLLPLFGLARAADTLKGVVHCLNHEECLGAGRECSFMHDSDGNILRDAARVGSCVCRPGYQRRGDSWACARIAPEVEVRETCRRDEDCRLGEVCMTWQYDPSTDSARKLRSGLNPTRGERHQLCIDAWVIQNHMAELDEPRTGGGLRSHRRDNFNADEYFFGGRRPPRVHQQYIGFAEDMMLILFLVCILATLVTVHRATCYRQFQEARRNSPLRHLLPIAEDRPPPYSHAGGEQVDGAVQEVVCSAQLPKRVSETPPPSYEEALYRNSVRIPAPSQAGSQTSQPVEIILEDSSPPHSFSYSSSPPSLSSPPPSLSSSPPSLSSSLPHSASPGPPADTVTQAAGTPQTSEPPVEPPKEVQEEEGKEQEEQEVQEQEVAPRDTCTVVVGQGIGPAIPV